MGRYRKYKTDQALRRAAEGYFASISRTEKIMEERRTGEKDSWGHFETEWVPVANDQGETVTVREYVVPPTAGGLCRYLGISRETWSRYCDGEENPQFRETTRWVREELRGYLEEQLLTRSGKDLKGVIFSLQNNYGMSEKRTVELGPKAAQAVASAGSEREALLQRLLEEMEPMDPGDGFPVDNENGENITSPDEAGEDEP